MPGKLKIDFHTHTGEDPADFMPYSAVEMIDEAADLNFDALAITNHDALLYTEELVDYARTKGILLIPGMELTLSKKHVLIINPGFEDNPGGRPLSALPGLKNDENLIIAPHPFYLKTKSLADDLEAYRTCFDAVEFSQYYNKIFDLNARALKFASHWGLPVVGTSDCHFLWTLGRTYTLVESEKSVPAIISAVKRGRVEVVTSPMSLFTMSRVMSVFEWRRIRHGRKMAKKEKGTG